MKQAGEGKRRKFSAEYKAEVVKLLSSSDKSIAAMSRELGIGETALRRWVEQAAIDGGGGGAGALTTTEREELTRLMREQSLRARPKRRYRRTTDSRHGLPVSANLLARRFTAAAPNLAWVTDITYIWTLEGWLYLAVMLDLFSRRVVGFAMSERIDLQLALDALVMAIKQRQPAAGLLHHSDRGSQYASYQYRQVLDRHAMVGSMSRRADCWDNAVAESFFASLKVELVYPDQWRTRTEARSAIFEYIEGFSNRRGK